MLVLRGNNVLIHIKTACSPMNKEKIWKKHIDWIIHPLCKMPWFQPHKYVTDTMHKFLGKTSFLYEWRAYST